MRWSDDDVQRRGDDRSRKAGQAFYDHGEIEAERSAEPRTPEESEKTPASARAIKTLDPDVVYFSHDRETWP